MFSALQEALRIWLEDPAARNVVAGTAMLCLYYVAAWLLVGRDPAPGTIVILYDPPEGLSPAAMRYLRKKGFDEKAFTAALINMATKGFIEIEQTGDGYSLRPGREDASVLAPEEEALAKALLGRGFSIELSSQNHERIYQAIRAAKHALDLNIEKVYMQTNRGYLIPGAVGSALLLIYSVLEGQPEDFFPAVFLMGFVLFWTLCCLILVLYLGHVWRSVQWLPGRPGVPRQQAVTSSLFAVPFLGGEIGALIWLGRVTRPWIPVFLLGLAGLLLLVYVLLKAPTRAGRQLLDQVEGFRRFLGAVEEDRLNKLNMPERTPQLFQKYLPYAFALDEEKAWTRRFSDLLVVSAESNIERAETAGNQWATLDLSSFGVFVQRWFPIELGKVELSIGPRS